MVRRGLGRSGLEVSPIGFGAFKIGRNTGTNNAQRYELPGAGEVARLLDGILDLGINYIDTAPAYGLSEERLGRALAGRRGEVVISTKVGETFKDGRSTYDFSAAAVRGSVQRSLKRLGREVIDVLFVHSGGDDLAVSSGTDVVATLQDLRRKGVVRAIGLSARTVEGARAALHWADALMVEYHLEDTSHAQVIGEAHAACVGVVVKKGLASGRLDPAKSIRFVLSTPGVCSMLIGSLSLEHLRADVAAAGAAR